MEKEKNCGCRENMEWISVDTPPEEKGLVLVFDSFSQRQLCYYDGQFELEYDHYHQANPSVKKWSKLPAAPKH